MSQELDEILISSSEPNFREWLGEFRKRMMHQAGIAGYGGEETVKVVEIIRTVASEGDKAVAAYTEKFDAVKLSPGQFRISDESLREAHGRLETDEPELMRSIRKAIDNVRRYQRKIFTGSGSEFSGGTGLRYMPLRRVGVCVPGASAPLPSTVIMTAVPAQVAGVREIVVVSPPRFEGTIHPVIQAVCCELGLDEVYRIGGSQAVAVLALGTETVGKVDKIVGPGNRWVQIAKKLVAGDHVGIDLFAGPSEVLVIANEQAEPAWVAADMLSQAEHAADSSAIVLVDSEETAKQILAKLKKQAAELDRADAAKESLKKFGAIIVVKDMTEAIEYANEFASEHVEIQCGDNSRKIAEQIRNAGAIFIGRYTPVAVGDYWAGPSHTLPTGGRAVFSSALTSNDFVKSTSIIEYSEKTLAKCAEDIVRLAEVEGLHAHARSVKIRQDG